jgi:hypothetical protein
MINVRTLPRELGRGIYGTIRFGFGAIGFGVRVGRSAVGAVTRRVSSNGAGPPSAVIEPEPPRARPAPRVKGSARKRSAPAPRPERAAAPPPPRPERAAAPPPPRPEAPRPPAAQPPEPAAAPPPEPEPTHVSEEPTLAAESAEPGAENGAGAELRVDPPWPGYAKLTAAEIRDRLASATDEELAAIELYESTHRRRQTIIDAAADALRRRTVGR